MDNKFKSNIYEFFRYCLIGGICAVADMLVNYLTLYHVLNSDKNNTLHVTIAVSSGFIIGLIANFILSNIFVFNKAEQVKNGKTLKAFIIFAVVGVIGYVLSLIFTQIGTAFIGDSGIWYLFLCCVVKGIVLVWNYIGRKIFVYHGK